MNGTNPKVKENQSKSGIDVKSQEEEGIYEYVSTNNGRKEAMMRVRTSDQQELLFVTDPAEKNVNGDSVCHVFLHQWDENKARDLTGVVLPENISVSAVRQDPNSNFKLPVNKTQKIISGGSGHPQRLFEVVSVEENNKTREKSDCIKNKLDPTQCSRQLPKSLSKVSKLRKLTQFLQPLNSDAQTRIASNKCSSTSNSGKQHCEIIMLDGPEVPSTSKAEKSIIDLPISQLISANKLGNDTHPYIVLEVADSNSHVPSSSFGAVNMPNLSTLKGMSNSSFQKPMTLLSVNSVPVQVPLPVIHVLPSYALGTRAQMPPAIFVPVTGPTTSCAPGTMAQIPSAFNVPVTGQTPSNRSLVPENLVTSNSNNLVSSTITTNNGDLVSVTPLPNTPLKSLSGSEASTTNVNLVPQNFVPSDGSSRRFLVPKQVDSLGTLKSIDNSNSIVTQGDTARANSSVTGSVQSEFSGRVTSLTRVVEISLPRISHEAAGSSTVNKKLLNEDKMTQTRTLPEVSNSKGHADYLENHLDHPWRVPRLPLIKERRRRHNDDESDITSYSHRLSGRASQQSRIASDTESVHELKRCMSPEALYKPLPKIARSEVQSPGFQSFKQPFSPVPSFRSESIGSSSSAFRRVRSPQNSSRCSPLDFRMRNNRPPSSVMWNRDQTREKQTLAMRHNFDDIDMIFFSVSLMMKRFPRNEVAKLKRAISEIIIKEVLEERSERKRRSDSRCSSQASVASSTFK